MTYLLNMRKYNTMQHFSGLGVKKMALLALCVSSHRELVSKIRTDKTVVLIKSTFELILVYLIVPESTHRITARYLSLSAGETRTAKLCRTLEVIIVLFPERTIYTRPS